MVVARVVRVRGCGAGGEAFIAVERRWRLGGMRRRPAAGIMAVGAGVNGGRGSARRRDASGRRRPLQASLCRGRRRLYGVNGGGVRAAGGPVPWLDASRLGERVHARARTSGPGRGHAAGERLGCSRAQASGSGRRGARRGGRGLGTAGARAAVA